MKQEIQTILNGVDVYPKVCRKVYTFFCNNADWWINPGHQFPFKDVWNASGIPNLITTDDGKIVIGHGVIKILLSWQAWVYCSNPNSRPWATTAHQRGADRWWISDFIIHTQDYANLCMAPKLLDVQEGDLIYVQCDTLLGINTNSGRTCGTYMTVEVVEMIE